jgi:hypothetical protein
MKRIIVAALTLPVFLVGCGAPSAEYVDKDTRGDTTQLTNPDAQEIENGRYDITVIVKEIDGVKCRIAQVFESVAIDCEEPVKEEVFQ